MVGYGEFIHNVPIPLSRRNTDRNRSATMTPDPSDAIKLTMEQSFERERMARTIDETRDPEALRKMCRMLLDAWQVQKAANAWLLKNPLPAPPTMAGHKKA